MASSRVSILGTDTELQPAPSDSSSSELVDGYHADEFSLSSLTALNVTVEVQLFLVLY